MGLTFVRNLALRVWRRFEGESSLRRESESITGGSIYILSEVGLSRGGVFWTISVLAFVIMVLLIGLWLYYVVVSDVIVIVV